MFGQPLKLARCVFAYFSDCYDVIFLKTLDYLGDMVAGGEIKHSYNTTEPDANEVEEKSTTNEQSLKCWHIPQEGLRRIPEIELMYARKILLQQNLPFMTIATRKYAIDIDKLQTY